MMRVGDPTYYAYVHAYPGATTAKDIFYVGKGRGKRGRNTLSRSPEHRGLIQSFEPEKPLMGWVPCSSSAIAYELERGLIKCLRRSGVELLNKTVGGEGATEFKHTEETKRLLSEAKLGDKNPMRRPEVAAKAHANLTPEGRLARAEGARTPQARANQKKAQLAAWKDPGIRSRRIAAMNLPERKAAQSKRFRENNPSSRPDVKIMRAKQSRENWANPEIRARVTAKISASWTDERKEQFSRDNPSHRAEVNAKKSAALKGRPHQKATCPHCGREGGFAIMMRHHFDRCKLKT